MNERLVRILGGNTEYYPCALESKFPRIFATIMGLWDEPEIEDYFMDLIVDKRGGRMGFPQEVVSEIVFLSFLHAKQHQSRSEAPPWSNSTDTLTSVDANNTKTQTKVWIAPPQALQLSIEKLGGTCSLAGFLQATESGNRALVGLFLDARVDLATRNERGWNALMLSAFYGHAQIIELLIVRGADVYARDREGNTALHWAAFAGHLNCAKQLISHHADVNARNSLSVTPLLQAARNRHLEMLLLLVKQGANLNFAGLDGNTALHWAASLGYSEILRVLLAHQADRKLKNLAGDTPVKWAIKNKHDKCVQLLLSQQPS